MFGPTVRSPLVQVEVDRFCAMYFSVRSGNGSRQRSIPMGRGHVIFLSKPWRLSERIHGLRHLLNLAYLPATDFRAQT